MVLPLYHWRKHVPKWIFLISASLLLLTGCTADGKKLANEMDLEGQSFSHIKKGYYCSDGNCTEQHNIGYIYYTDELTQEEAMEQAGFQKDKTEYTNGPESAEIVEVEMYQNGYLLEYRITGSG